MTETLDVISMVCRVPIGNVEAKECRHFYQHVFVNGVQYHAHQS